MADELREALVRAAKRLAEFDRPGLAQACYDAERKIEATEAAFQGVMKDNADLSAEIQSLQRALAFWLPQVPAADNAAAIRCGNDALLLVGYDGPQETCAEELGWITMHTPLADGCHRSHPHEDMNAECQRLTEVARTAAKR